MPVVVVTASRRASLHEAGPPPTCAQLLDDADIHAVAYNLPVMSSCLNLSFLILSHYSTIAYFARCGMGVGAFVAINKGAVMDG